MGIPDEGVAVAEAGGAEPPGGGLFLEQAVGVLVAAQGMTGGESPAAVRTNVRPVRRLRQAEISPKLGSFVAAGV